MPRSPVPSSAAAATRSRPRCGSGSDGAATEQSRAPAEAQGRRSTPCRRERYEACSRTPGPKEIDIIIDANEAAQIWQVESITLQRIDASGHERHENGDADQQR